MTKPTYLIAGKIQREYILPPAGFPIIDEMGGSLLYAASGLALWDKQIGLLARVGSDFPKTWLADLKKRGFDTNGIRVQPDPIDLRLFIAYNDKNELSGSNTVSHFARRKIQFPKSLLGYQALDDSQRDPREIDPVSPSALDVPKNFRDISYIHLCPFDFTSQSQLVNLFRGSTQTVSLDPASSYMNPTFWRDLRIVLEGVKIFMPSEEELRALFWGQMNDLWEMMKTISDYGPEIVIVKRGGMGQAIYDSVNKKRYEIPAYSSRMDDPTGAGDSFCGGFLAGYQKTKDARMAAVYGGVSASLTIEGSGPFYSHEVLDGLADARLHALEQLVREV